MGRGAERHGSKRGARLLVQVAANPACRLMTTAAAFDLPLPTLDDADRPVGEAAEGVSRLAMANGNRFETALWRDELVQRALIEAGLLPKEPVQADFRGDRRPVERLEREVLGFLHAAAQGEAVPDLLCHPPLRLQVAPGLALALTPDYLRLVRADGGTGRYVAGEVKAFHDLGPDTDPLALQAAERQVSVYDLALDAALDALGVRPAHGPEVADLMLRRPHARAFRVALRANRPTRPHKDWFRRQALPALATARQAWLEEQARAGRPPELTALPTHLTAACAGACAAFDWCLARARAAGDLRALPDAAERLAPLTTLTDALTWLDGTAQSQPTGDPALAAVADHLREWSGWAGRLRPVDRR